MIDSLENHIIAILAIMFFVGFVWPPFLIVAWVVAISAGVAYTIDLLRGRIP